MEAPENSTKQWIIIGIVSGLLVSIVYPSLMFIPFPQVFQTLLIMIFGPLLALSSAGLYFFISLHKKSISASAALVSNIIAGVLITTMLLVQVAIRSSHPEEISEAVKWTWTSLNRVHLGLDASWDIYIALGTLLFSLSMFNHPKLGKIISVSGVLISVALIILNAVSFPIPPANAGFFDLGPIIGLWYFIITLMIIFRLKWVDEKLESIRD
jgi:hypothetical protein